MLPSATMVTRMVVSFQALLATLSLKIVECCGIGICKGLWIKQLVACRTILLWKVLATQICLFML